MAVATKVNALSGCDRDRRILRDVRQPPAKALRLEQLRQGGV